MIGSITALQIRVHDASEAAIAAAAGVDAVELRLAAFDDEALALARAVRIAFPGTLRLSLDGLAFAPAEVEAALSVGADELALAIDASPPSIPIVDAVRTKALARIALLGVAPDSADAVQRVRARVDGIMIEAGRAARLFDRAGIAALAALADACRASGLPFGFSGGLEAPDVARLLLLRPDVLGFDVAVRGGHTMEGRLLPHLLDQIRGTIPRGAPDASDAADAAVSDTIFVRDFVALVSIGAYRAEEQGRQRVRFGVEAVVARRAGVPRDMRDVFSYDVILETIRVLAARGHVAFVETLAEELAAALLAHPAIARVVVRVEKLDVVEGVVGVEIVRQRPTA